MLGRLRRNIAEILDWRRERAIETKLSALGEQHRQDRPPFAHLAHDHIGRKITLQNYYDRRILDVVQTVLTDRQRAGTMLDVGANIGNHSVYFAGSFKRVIAMEPDPTNLALLQFNARPFPNIEVFGNGASDRAATVRALIPSGNAGAATITHRTEAADEAVSFFDVLPIDEMESVRRANITFCKLDVEGHEAFALRGAARTIERCRPLLLLEQLATEIDRGSSEAIEMLRSMGYHFFYTVDPRPWRVLDRFPAALRIPLRFLEASLHGVPERDFAIRPIEQFDQRDYPAILASDVPISC